MIIRTELIAPETYVVIMMTLMPAESGEHIVKNAKYLHILPEGIKTLANEIVTGILNKRIDVANFSQNELHPKPTDENALEWIFVVDTLNFCFWTPIDSTKYKVDGHTGYFALCAAINRAIKNGIDMTNASYYSNINTTNCPDLFISDDKQTSIPLINERYNCLQEVGKRLVSAWKGKFENVVKAADHSAIKLLYLIVNEFNCFRDEAVYAGKQVSFYKRAQILIGDIWSCYRGEGIGYFKDIDQITMFADYRVPQVLVHFGSLEYTPELVEILKAEQILNNGCEMEVEIRGASVYIVEQVKAKVLCILEEKYPNVSKRNINSILIDHYLWDYRRRHAAQLDYIPFHKVLSIYY